MPVNKNNAHSQLKVINSSILDVKVSGKYTIQAIAIFEQISLPPGGGKPLHIHLSQNKIFYVLGGAYCLQ